jgi:hypothetical protein
MCRPQWNPHESDRYVFSRFSFTEDEYGHNRDISIQHFQPVYCTAFVYRQIDSVVNSESVQFNIISKYVQDLKTEWLEYFVLFHFLV